MRAPSRAARESEGTPTAGRATLADVAASAGVSIATVSKVLNGRSDVSAATRARVLDLLSQHDYVGRRPEQVEAPTVELFFQGELTTYSLEIVQGVLDEASTLGVSVVVSVRPSGSRSSG